ncbi:MAG: metal-dependent hydrolase [Leptolyngbyaceae cyanobacterium SL_7_1]|nr:metal-dependent hydrolase [Leptolyngbyaceae cyanobacterium SL_7_1]
MSSRVWLIHCTRLYKYDRPSNPSSASSPLHQSLHRSFTIMMSVTHCAIALTTVSVTLGTASPSVLAVSVLGSQLPDLDSTASFVGRALYPIASFLESRFPHRTITHSFLSTGVVAIASLPLCLIHWHYWLALVLGQFTGWFADSFTRSGVAAFYPSPVRLVIPGNPRARLRSHSPAEYWVLGVVCFLAIASINLASAGGITEQFARSFFPDASTAATLFQRYGAERVVVVRVKGLHAHTSQAIDSTYTVIEANSQDLIGQEEISGKLYKIGNAPDVQIRANRVWSSLGGAVAIAAQEQSLQEIGVGDWVTRLKPSVYLSGSLLLEDMEEIQIPLELESYPALRVFGGQVELSNAQPAQISALLGECWITSGQVIVKERTYAESRAGVGGVSGGV